MQCFGEVGVRRDWQVRPSRSSGAEFPHRAQLPPAPPRDTPTSQVRCAGPAPFLARTAGSARRIPRRGRRRSRFPPLHPRASPRPTRCKTKAAAHPTDPPLLNVLPLHAGLDLQAAPLENRHSAGRATSPGARKALPAPAAAALPPHFLSSSSAASSLASSLASCQLVGLTQQT
jgi:hypothetical protein